MVADLPHLRTLAVTSSLFSPCSLEQALDRMGFVQADPIRSPARAQDLILRNRVIDYHAGDLEKHYPALNFEEDLLYAYGFVTQQTSQWLHPRTAGELPELASRVLELVHRHGALHPRDLQVHLGNERAVNPWGGYSKATTQMLERLHYSGHLRIACRRDGIRVYAPAPPRPEPLEHTERIRQLVFLVAKLLSPVPETSLRAALNHLRHSIPSLSDRTSAIKALVHEERLRTMRVDCVNYLWTGEEPGDPPREVKFLAPFDPLVWDRRRFEHLWGWPYRFEAYTPGPKRRFGYYAMPLLWIDQVVGWVNISLANNKVQADIGYAESRPKGRDFRQALEREIAQMQRFLLATKGRQT